MLAFQYSTPNDVTMTTTSTMSVNFTHRVCISTFAMIRWFITRCCGQDRRDYQALWSGPSGLPGAVVRTVGITRRCGQDRRDYQALWSGPSGLPGAVVRTVGITRHCGQDRRDYQALWSGPSGLPGAVVRTVGITRHCGQDHPSP